MADLYTNLTLKKVTKNYNSMVSAAYAGFKLDGNTNLLNSILDGAKKYYADALENWDKPPEDESPTRRRRTHGTSQVTSQDHATEIPARAHRTEVFESRTRSGRAINPSQVAAENTSPTSAGPANSQNPARLFEGRNRPARPSAVRSPSETDTDSDVGDIPDWPANLRKRKFVEVDATDTNSQETSTSSTETSSDTLSVDFPSPPKFPGLKNAKPTEKASKAAKSSDHGTASPSKKRRIVPSPEQRKRVSKACQVCRKKKQRCDGMKPCTQCNRNPQACTYDQPGEAAAVAHPLQPFHTVSLKQSSQLPQSEWSSAISPEGKKSLNVILKVTPEKLAAIVGSSKKTEAVESANIATPDKLSDFTESRKKTEAAKAAKPVTPQKKSITTGSPKKTKRSTPTKRVTPDASATDRSPNKIKKFKSAKQVTPEKVFASRRSPKKTKAVKASSPVTSEMLATITRARQDPNPVKTAELIATPQTRIKFKTPTSPEALAVLRGSSQALERQQSEDGRIPASQNPLRFVDKNMKNGTL